MVDTVGIKESVRFRNTPHSAQMRIHERMRRLTPDHFENVITVTDPVYLTGPWQWKWVYQRRPNYKMYEYVCEDNREYADPETGAARVDRLTAVADAGVVVNPRLIEGQVHGGIVHGLGNAAMEEAAYDEDTGQLLSGTLMDYALPHADDVPALAVEMIATRRSASGLPGSSGVSS